MSLDKLSVRQTLKNAKSSVWVKLAKKTNKTKTQKRFLPPADCSELNSDFSRWICGNSDLKSQRFRFLGNKCQSRDKMLTLPAGPSLLCLHPWNISRDTGTFLGLRTCDLLHACLRMNSDSATEMSWPDLEGCAKLALGVCTAVLRPLQTPAHCQMFPNERSRL